MTEAQRKLRQLINRIDVICKKINDGYYQSMYNVRDDLIDALQKTGEHIH